MRVFQLVTFPSLKKIHTGRYQVGTSLKEGMMYCPNLMALMLFRSYYCISYNVISRVLICTAFLHCVTQGQKFSKITVLGAPEFLSVVMNGTQLLRKGVSLNRPFSLLLAAASSSLQVVYTVGSFYAHRFWILYPKNRKNFSEINSVRQYQSSAHQL